MATLPRLRLGVLLGTLALAVSTGLLDSSVHAQFPQPGMPGGPGQFPRPPLGISGGAGIGGGFGGGGLGFNGGSKDVWICEGCNKVVAQGTLLPPLFCPHCKVRLI